MAESMAAECHERAQNALSSSPIHAMRVLRVEQDCDALIISGRVETFYHKQLAQELVRAVSNGCQLINSIDVHDAHARRE